MFLLVARTERGIFRTTQVDISYLLVIAMCQPGVDRSDRSVQITGSAEFNEVFFDDARIPRDWVIGEVNAGWGLAVALMKHERTTLGSGQRSTEGSKAGRFPLPIERIGPVGRASWSH